MKRLMMLLLVAATGTTTSTALAQNPSRLNGDAAPAASRSLKAPTTSIEAHDVQATPEMWFYEREMQRYNNPDEMVRQNAAFEFAQRKQRLAAQKWYGYSKSRPTVNPTPFGASYSPTWTNAMVRPNSWARQGQIYVIRSNGN